MIKHISLFSGIGGAEAALDLCHVNHTTLWRSEIDRKVDLIYQTIWKADPTKNIGDISTFTWDTVNLNATVDLVTGGFPCQPFSRLGKREGVNDIRFIRPFQGILNVVKVFEPKFIMLENVELPKDAIEHVLSKIGELGYECLVTKMCPHHDLGYIQKRKRIYITCWRSDQDAWVPSVEYLNKTMGWQTLTFDEDVNTGRHGNCYAIAEKRVVNLFDGKSVYCITARGHDAHCKHMTWVKCSKSHTGYRGYTPFELHQLFGWGTKKYEFVNILKQSGISRSSFYHAIGNSWHVGHASYILNSCPLVQSVSNQREIGEGYGSFAQF